MTLKEATEMFVKGKIFLQEYQGNASLHKYLAPVEGLVRALEAMTFPARSRQTDVIVSFWCLCPLLTPMLMLQELRGRNKVPVSLCLMCSTLVKC
jgi:hypothetical protein